MYASLNLIKIKTEILEHTLISMYSHFSQS